MAQYVSSRTAISGFTLPRSRRALRDGHAGNRYITNIPWPRLLLRRAGIRRRGAEEEIAVPRVVERPTGHAGSVGARVVGRSDAVPALAAQLKLHRFVTIVRSRRHRERRRVAVAVANGLLGFIPGWRPLRRSRAADRSAACAERPRAPSLASASAPTSRSRV